MALINITIGMNEGTSREKPYEHNPSSRSDLKPRSPAEWYFLNAVNDLEYSLILASAQLVSLGKPFSTSGYHTSSLFYPFTNLLKAIWSLTKVALGVFFLMEALFNDPCRSIPAVLFTMGLNVVNAVVHTVNAALSAISFATRTFATIFCLGYSTSRCGILGLLQAGQDLICDTLLFNLQFGLVHNNKK